MKEQLFNFAIDKVSHPSTSVPLNAVNAFLALRDAMNKHPTDILNLTGDRPFVHKIKLQNSEGEIVEQGFTIDLQN